MMQLGLAVDKVWLSEHFQVPLENQVKTASAVPSKAPKNEFAQTPVLSNVKIIQRPLPIVTNEGDTDILAEVDKLAKKVYQANPSDLDSAELYKEFMQTLASKFDSKLGEGYGIGIAYDVLDLKVLSFLKQNLFVFSSAKSQVEVAQMSQLLTDENGKVRSFNDFLNAVKTQVNPTLNVSYLEAEYNLAVSSAQMASKWQEIQRKKGVLPLLVYDAVGDERTRPEHKALDGTTLPVDDEFWNENTPPNDWGCRCSLRQVASGEVTQNPTPLALKPLFKNNVGKTGMVFPPSHAYYETAKNYQIEQVLAQLNNEKLANITYKVTETDEVRAHITHANAARFMENVAIAEQLLNSGYTVHLQENGAIDAKVIDGSTDYQAELRNFVEKEVSNDFTEANSKNADSLVLSVVTGTKKASLIKAIENAKKGNITTVFIIHPNGKTYRFAANDIAKMKKDLPEF